MNLDKGTVRAFWRKRATTGTTRWTGPRMLEFDQGVVRPLVDQQSRILDLGSGFGELSRSICGPSGTLVAVEQEASMGSAFADDPRFSFEVSNVVDYEPQGPFDIVLLFGVVTYLTETEENTVYDIIARALASGGVAVIKNQCSDGADFDVSIFSEHLASAYVGRYPSAEKQRRRLLDYFAVVDPVTYPAEFKEHPNSTHVAFVCRDPR